MIDISDQVRQAFDPLPEVGMNEIVSAAQRRHRRHRRMAGLLAGLTAVSVSILVLSMAVGGTNPTRVKTSPAPQHPGEVSLPTSPTTGGGAPLTATLQLPTTSMPTGGTLSGHIVVENNTGSAIRVNGACNYIFAAVLAEGSYQPPPVWLQCLSTVIVPVGRSSYPVQLVAQYRGCQPAHTPPCVEGQPLPPGRYQAKVYEYGNTVPVPAPVTVTVTASGPDSGKAASKIGRVPVSTVLKNTTITYRGAIPASYYDSDTGLRLTPPPEGTAPAVTWQQAATPCVQTTNTNNCASATSPENVYLAIGNDANFGPIGAKSTLMYVIEEAELCSSTGNAPPGRPDPISTTIARRTVACPYLAFVNATTGQGMGAISGPGIKPIPSE